MKSTNQEAAFDGQCAFAVSVGKLGVAGSPHHSLETGAETYYFKNGVARFLWKVLPGRMSKAQQVWETAAG